MKMKLLVAALLGATMMTACNDEPDTPGEALDQTIEETGDALEEAGEDLSDTAEDAAEEIDDTVVPPQ